MSSDVAQRASEVASSADFAIAWAILQDMKNGHSGYKRVSGRAVLLAPEPAQYAKLHLQVYLNFAPGQEQQTAASAPVASCRN